MPPADCRSGKKSLCSKNTDGVLEKMIYNREQERVENNGKIDKQSLK